LEIILFPQAPHLKFTAIVTFLLWRVNGGSAIYSLKWIAERYEINECNKI